MARYNDPYCEHGTYVGGCGADYMCGWCEDGVPWPVYQAYLNRQIRKRTTSTVLSTIFSAQPLSLLMVPNVVVSMTAGLLNASRVHS